MRKINRSKKRDRKKRVYVSDIHMGAGRSFKPDCGCHIYDWLGPKEAKNFSKFLDFLLASADIEESKLSLPCIMSGQCLQAYQDHYYHYRQLVESLEVRKHGQVPE